ncbi:Arm DNA-binding domain-containing protein [Azorhizobium caulinodans]|uniref:Arm DNA-binding domain-containing protein n=1 Tax=Azorhizobium caulinodans TaxID=7 RepID=UPI0039EB6F76
MPEHQTRPKAFQINGSAGLYVSPTGGKLRRCDRLDGKRRTASFGAYPIISLAEARKARDDLKRQPAGQFDPTQVARASKRARVLLANNTHVLERGARVWALGASGHSGCRSGGT